MDEIRKPTMLPIKNVVIMDASEINTQDNSSLRGRFRGHWEKYQKTHESNADINISDKYDFIEDSCECTLFKNFDLESGCLVVQNYINKDKMSTRGDNQCFATQVLLCTHFISLSFISTQTPFFIH